MAHCSPATTQSVLVFLLPLTSDETFNLYEMHLHTGMLSQFYQEL